MNWWQQFLVEGVGGAFWLGFFWLGVWGMDLGPVPSWGWAMAFLIGCSVAGTRVDAKRWAGKL